METYFSLADLVDVSAGKASTIQLWAKERLIRPVKDTDGAGKGVHRAYDLAEAELTAVLARFSRYGATIKALKLFASSFREVAFEVNSKDPVRRLIDAARDGDEAIWLAFLRIGKGVSITAFRWDEGLDRTKLFPDKADDAFLVNLSRTWKRIPKESG